jgi:hypothetical protein
MFDPKLSGIAGIIAFILSSLVGFISGVGLPWLLIRALIFGGAFFVLAGCAYWLVTQFLPELLDQGEEEAGLDAGSPGSRVDISVSDEGDTGAGMSPGEDGISPGMDASLGLTDLVGSGSSPDANADPLSGNGLDQKAQDGYTKEGAVDEGPVKAFPSSPTGAAVPETESDMVDELPDLELMRDVFISSPIEDGGAGLIDPSPGRSAGGNKPQNLGGDFNVKEMASAIQTILKREDKG